MRINAWQADVQYKKNFKNASSLSFGARWNSTRTDKDLLHADLSNGNYVRDDGQSNRFIYDEMVSALFVSYNRVWNKVISSSIGLRGEHTHIQGDLHTTNEVFRNNYFNVLPNASLGITLAEGKHMLGLDYSSRLFRPFYQFLNPFKIWTSATTYRMGNPDLEATYTHALDFRYILLGKYALALSGMWSPKSFADFTTSDGQNNTVVSYRTFGRQRYFEAKLAGQQSFLRGHLRASANVGAGYHNYKINVQNVESIKHGWQFTVNGSVNAYLGKLYKSGLTAYYLWQGRHTEAARVDNAGHYLSVSAWTIFKWSGQLSLSYSVNIPGDHTYTFDLPNYRYISHSQSGASVISVTYVQTFGKKKVKDAKGHLGNTFSGRM